MVRAGEIVELGQSEEKFVFLGQARKEAGPPSWVFYEYEYKDMLNRPLNTSFLRCFKGFMTVRNTGKKLNSKALDSWYIKSKLASILPMPDICSYELGDDYIICNEPKIGCLYACPKVFYSPYALYLGYKYFLLLDHIPLNEKEIDEMESFAIVKYINVLNMDLGHQYSMKKMPHLYENLENLKK